MIPNEHLPFFITEQIYVLEEPAASQTTDGSIEPSTEAPSTPQLPTDERSSVPPIKSDVIIVCDPCSDSDRNLLTKILAAVNVKLEDVALLESLPTAPLEYERLLIFGHHEVPSTGRNTYDTDQTKSWMRAASLQELATSQEEKVKLWNALKAWFQIS